MAMAALALVGCASKAVRPNDAELAPPDRLTGYQSVPEGDYGRVTFTRDNGFVGGGCYIDIIVDSTTLARLNQGEKATGNIAVGRHVVYGKPAGRALCSAGNSSRAERASQIYVEKNDNITFRVAVDAGGIITVNPTLD